MTAMRKNSSLITILAFGLYFLVGAGALLVGSSLTQLIGVYGRTMDAVVLLGSSFAIGRVSTVGLTGRLVEKIGAKAVYAISVLATCVYFVGIPLFPNYYAGMAAAFLGGVGMGAEDAVCPLMLSISCRNNYAGALSAGQAFFCVGSFAMPFLIGVMLSERLPFYGAFYVLTAIALILLVCLPFVRLEKQTKTAETQEEQVKPLYTKKLWLAYAGALIGVACFSGAVNVLSLYTASFAQSMGISEANAAFMLTIYNIGGVIGSFAFTWILKKVKERIIVIINSVISMIALAAAILFHKTEIYFICLFITGTFLGVMFSLFVAITTRIGYKRISVASSYVAIAAGISDVMTPILSGALVGVFGVGSAFYYALATVVLMLASSILVNAVTSEKEISSYGNSKQGNPE